MSKSRHKKITHPCPICGKLKSGWASNPIRAHSSCAQIKPQKITIPKCSWILAYAGGYIDADGSVSKGSIAVSSIDIEPIHWFLYVFGGGVYVSNIHGTSRFTQKPVFVWQISAKADIKALLQALTPYSTKCKKLHDKMTKIDSNCVL